MKWSFWKWGLKTVGALGLAMCLMGEQALASDVTLAWNAKTETDLAGYRVYFGNASRNYGSPLDAGKNATFTITGLSAGAYYFAVTAYYTSGVETGYSNEVTTTLATSTDTRISAPSNVIVK